MFCFRFAVTNVFSHWIVCPTLYLFTYTHTYTHAHIHTLIGILNTDWDALGLLQARWVGKYLQPPSMCAWLCVCECVYTVWEFFWVVCFSSCVFLCVIVCMSACAGLPLASALCVQCVCASKCARVRVFVYEAHQSQWDLCFAPDQNKSTK